MENQTNALKTLLHESIRLYRDKKASPRSLKTLIDEYNKISNEIGKPSIQPYDEKTDSDGYDTHIRECGLIKLIKIRTTLNVYLKKLDRIPEAKAVVSVLLEIANEIAQDKDSSPYSLKALIDEYNSMSTSLGMPSVQAYDEKTDSDGYDTHIRECGLIKLIQIRLELGIYLKTFQGISIENAVIETIAAMAEELNHLKEKASSYALKALIEKYNGCGLENLPQVPSYKEETDSDGIYIAEEGFTKLEAISSNLSNYKR